MWPVYRVRKAIGESLRYEFGGRTSKLGLWSGPVFERTRDVTQEGQQDIDQQITRTSYELRRVSDTILLNKPIGALAHCRTHRS